MLKERKIKEHKQDVYAKPDRRRIGGAIAALFAAMAVFVVMMQTEKNILAKYEKVLVYVTAERISKGELITENNLDTLFISCEVDKACVSNLVLCEPSQLIGLAAMIDIEPGTLSTKDMFEQVDNILANIKEPVIAGFKAEDLYQVTGGILRAGDRIHIYTVSEENETILLWENVYVQGVFDQAGGRILNSDTTTAAQRLNVYLAKADVEDFYSGLASGTLRVVRVCR